MNEIEFLNHKFENPISLLDAYLPICKNILSSDEEILRRCTFKLRNNLTKWASDKCNVYRKHNIGKIFTRNELTNWGDWGVPELKSECSTWRTSGSTTGEPFAYPIWKRYEKFLKNDCHWKLILDEFGFSHKITTCVFYYFKHTNEVFDNNPELFVKNHRVKFASHYNHGNIENDVFFFNFLQYEVDQWENKVLDFFLNNKIDVLISTGPVLNRLCSAARALGRTEKICSLLSHNNEFPMQSDLDFLKESGMVDYLCDHMRCWDGGATFFTCKYGTRHLMDNISMCEENEEKLISTDFFSLAAPFIDYWNGDLCSIDQTYKRCECGRLYREFKMKQNRPFALKGIKRLSEIRKEFDKLDYNKDILQVEFNNLSCRVVTKRKMDDLEIEKIKLILEEYNIIFEISN
jgi:hypothetical protein